MSSIEIRFLRGRYSVGTAMLMRMLEFPDQAVKLLLVHIAARDAHPVHPARAARTGTVDDHGVMRIKENPRRRPPRPGYLGDGNDRASRRP
jgi:hypothetical protein